MVGFRKKYFCLAIFVAAASFHLAGCNLGGEEASAPQKEPEKIVEENFKPTVVKLKDKSLGKDEKGNDAAARNRARKEVETRTLFDGSEYVAMRDGNGNKIEYRYFEAETGVKYISMETSADGSSSILVRTWDGFVKQINSSQIIDPWRASARDIALLTGFPLEYKHSQPTAPVSALSSVIVPLPQRSIVSKQLEPVFKSSQQAEKMKPEQNSQPDQLQPSSATPEQSAALRRSLGMSH